MALSGDLGSLFASDLPEGRQNLLDSHTNLEKVAEYCENNYFQCENKKQALEETKGYTTQSLASVAYQINTLAYNFLQMLDLQSAQLREMESQVNHISQTVDIHKEKVARREIGILTTNKSSNRQYKIIAPANPERPAKYVRKPIDYSLLDDIGHGVKVVSSQPPGGSTPRQIVRTSQYAPGLMMSGASNASGNHYAPGVGYVKGGSSGQPSSSAYGSLGNVSNHSGSTVGAGPAPTTKPPTPPQGGRYSSGTGTLTRGNKEYRAPSLVNPPQLPSNYAPNYPRGTGGKQYGTLPHPQVQMVHPVQQQDMEAKYSGSTMPRLSSSSMRSSGSQSSSGGGTLGRSQQQSHYGILRGGSGSVPSGMGQYGTSPMSRPTQRPPSPPLPPPPPQQPQQNQQMPQYNPVYGRQISAGNDSNSIYSRQSSVPSSLQQMQLDNSSIYSRQSSSASLQQQQQEQLARQNSAAQMAAAAAAAQQQKRLSRQSSMNSSINPNSSSSSLLPSWVPKNYIEKVVAIYDYNADKEDELSFQEGAKIFVLKKNDDGWWEGVMDGITGLFPGNYVEASV